MKDGSMVECDVRKADGSVRSDDGTVIWSHNVFFDRIIDPSQVASVEIGGASIKPLS